MSTAAAADGGQAKKPRTIRRVPITLLSGFLGGKRPPPTPQVARRRASRLSRKPPLSSAGKSTLLKHTLENKEGLKAWRLQLRTAHTCR